MDLPATAVALTHGPAPAVDPHLVVLGVLVAAWLIDEVFAALEWLEGARDDRADDSRDPGVGTDGGPAGDPSRGSTRDGGRGSSGARGGASRDASRLSGAE